MDTTDEPKPRPVLKDYERHAVMALVARQIQAMEIKNEAQSIMTAAHERIRLAGETLNNVRAAMTLFGISVEGKDYWDVVRAALGTEAFSQAVNIARGEEVEKIEDASPITEGEASGDEEPTLAQKEQSIRDIVYDFVRKAGADGVTSRDIQDHIAKSGLEIHEKTVGMNLYRLSKAGVVRRLGRKWFYAEAETTGTGRDATDPDE